MSQNKGEGRRQYYWIYAHDDDGKPYLIFGSDKDESDARRKGLEELGGVDFEIRKFPTRNLARASSMLKGHKLSTEHSLKKASARLGHDKSLRQTKRKERKKSPRFFDDNW